MNDYKITLNKRQEHFLSRLLPKGYSFQLYKVRKNINDYPYKEFDKKYKKTDSIILSKRQSVMFDSLQPSEKSFRQKSQVPSIPKENLSPFQINLLWLVKKLRKHQSSYPFRAPVDPKALQVPDYFDVVLEPIDLKKIEQRIRADHYHHMSQFERDIYKMMMNSYKFNQKSTTTYNKTIQFEEFFSETMKQWEKLKEEEQGQPKDDKDEVKEQMVEENATMTKRNEEMERKLEGFNLWNFKENNLSGIKQNNSSGLKQNIPVVAPPIPIIQPTPTSQKKEAKAAKIATDPNPQRPRISKKKLQKIQRVIKQLPRTQSRQLEPPSQPTKRQELQFSMEQQEQFLPAPMQQPVVPVVVVQNEPRKQQQQEVKNEQQEQNNDDLRDYLQNETVKEQNFSQGYNEFTAGNKIRNIQVQKEISSLLKKLNEYPLTKQKKNKLLSKLTNLDQNMTQTDKKKLFQKISKLDQNDIQYVIRIITRGKQEILKQDEFELDLDKADSKVLRQIQNFIAIRDNAMLMPIENNGALFPVSQSLEMIKLPKKVKKEEKKVLKKKLSRRNSNNDESFSINPPQIKKKNSQKPHKKHFKGDQQSSFNAQINSNNDEKSSSSSYRPQTLHQVRPATALHTHKPPQTQKTIQVTTQQKQKPSYQQKKRQQSSLKQNNNTSQHYDPNQIFITPNPQPYNHHTSYHYQANNYDDIDQFLISSSKHYPNDPQSSPQHGPFTSGRNKRQSMDQLDYIYDPDFQFGRSGLKDYEDEEIKEYSMEQQGDLENKDVDQFI